MAQRSSAKLWRGRAVAGPLLAAIVLANPAGAAAEVVDPWAFYYASQDHFYNGEYEQALQDAGEAIKLDPDNPFFHNSLANTYLFRELQQLGQLEGNLYDASNSFLKGEKPKPNPQRIAKFKQALEKARQLCEDRLAKNPRDVDALYSLGVSYATEGTYKFTIEKSWFDALRAGSKANDLHEKVLSLDAAYYDAKLVPGVYQYVVGSIPGSVKWFVFLIGYRGNKITGIRLMQEAMTKGKVVTSSAAFLLSVVYTREKRHDYARQLLRSLEQYYPRNPLIPLEIGRSYVREGNRKKGLEQYVKVAKDMEAGRPGYDRLPRERVWYQVGVLYQQQGQWDNALAAFANITDRSDSDGLLKAHSTLRRGEIFLAKNRPERARAEFEQVAQLPYEDARREAQEHLRSLK